MQRDAYHDWRPCSLPHLGIELGIAAWANELTVLCWTVQTPIPADARANMASDGPKAMVIRSFHVSWSGTGGDGTRSIGLKMGRGGRLDTRCSEVIGSLGFLSVETTRETRQVRVRGIFPTTNHVAGWWKGLPSSL